ncbi:SMI1/KNR4 family protein [Rosistilla oblonga]|uniref:SMI1/KNR4 family protein n=1 Tax=Rosistilla oblonga TaxID=2527990 RepID=UPI003A983B95
MTADELATLVKSTFALSDYAAERYPADDLERVTAFFGDSLPPLFLAMRGLLRTYAIPGDHLPADEMIHDHQWEVENNPNFTTDHIPFYAIGNGDYLCLSRSAGTKSPVLYVAHDDPNVDTLHVKFDDYLTDTDWFLHT